MEFRDSDTENESEEEGEVRPNWEKLTLSLQSTSLLEEVTSKPLRMLDAGNYLSAALYQLNAIMPFPPKLYKSISPNSLRKEDRLLSKLQQFTMDSLGVLIYLQEQLKGVQLTPRRLELQ